MTPSHLRAGVAARSRCDGALTPISSTRKLSRAADRHDDPSQRSWFNHRRLYEHCGDIPPAELKEAYYSHTTGLAETG